ncbi:MAG: Hsp70 family protein, partial [Lachnospiraceae bacterium]|nr:Hsp70 family protein [Lachnospiraceae bacterium]
QGAEAAKCRLEQEEEVEMTVEIGGKTCRARLDNDILFQICMPLFAKIKKLFVHILNDAHARVSELDDLIMVGGSSRLTVVRRFLKELLGKEPVVLGDTDKVVAMGAGVYAGIRMRREDIRDMLLTDVCPFTLGVETWRSKGDVQGCLLPMIERNSTLPASECKRLVTLHDYQDAIRIGIYQGEEYFAKDNLFLGELTIPVYPKPAGQEWVDVYFTYDINGILYVEVANSQDMRNHVLLTNQDLSKEELERYQKEMQKLMLPPIMQEENQRILATLQEYYENSTGARREEIGYFINWVVAGLNSRRIHRVRRVVEEAKRHIERCEAWKGQEEEWLFDGELKMGFSEDEEMEDWDWQEGSDGEGVYEDE